MTAKRALVVGAPEDQKRIQKEAALGSQVGTMSSFQQGKSLFTKGAYGQAIPLLEQAAAQDPAHFEAHFLLGVSYLRLDDFANSELYFRKAVALNDNAHLAHYYLGLVLERQGRLNDARLEYRIALAIKPDFSEALERLGSPAPDEPARGTPAAAGQYRPPTGPPPPAGPGSLAEQIAARKGQGGLLSAEAMAGNKLVARYRRMRSFSGHCLLVLVGLFLWSMLGLDLADHSPTADENAAFAAATVVMALLLVTLVWRSRATHYTIYERRIDIRTGLLFQKQASVWTYQIEQTWLTRSPLNILTGDATVHIRAADPGGAKGTVMYKITGLGNRRYMQETWIRLRDLAIVERREMKSVWV